MWRTALCVVAFVAVCPVGFSRAVVMHFSFDGTAGGPLPTSLLDDTGTYTATILSGTDMNATIKYGISNPSYNPLGTSAEFFTTSFLDGAGDTLLVPNTGGLDFSTLSAFTVEMFVYVDPAGTGHDRRLFSEYIYAYMYLDADNALHAVRKWGPGAWNTNWTHIIAPDFPTDQWNHVALVWDPVVIENKLQLYVDGELAAAGAGMADATLDSTAGFAIGGYQRENLTTSQFLLGRIDEFALHGEALDPSEFLIRTPGLAMRPRPRNGQIRVPTSTTTINWKPGDFAVSHDVYLGTSFEDVDAASDPDIPPGRGNQDANSFDPGQLELGTTYYWRIDEVNSLHGGSPWKGIVWSFTTAGAPYGPYPADGAEQAPVDAILSWMPGEGALSHDVYLGTNLAEVSNAVDPYTLPGRGNQDANSFSADLDLDTTYYWRIDEVTAAKTITGPVWSFTVGNTLVVDDFEIYTDSVNLKESWAQMAGAWVDLATTDMPHHGGEQAMQINYYHFFDTYSEGIRTFANDRDWSSKVKSMELYYSGQTPSSYANAEPERLYVYLEDADGSGAEVFRVLDVNEIGSTAWRTWNIDLAQFAAGGVNLGEVKKLAIGLGDRAGTTPSSTNGYMYFDDIVLYPPRCLPEYSMEADLTGDCLVNLEDQAVVAQDWQESEQLLDYGVLPNDQRQRLWYKFEEGTGTEVLDSSVNAKNGTIVKDSGPAVWETGYDGLCMSFNDDTAIAAPNDVLSSLLEGVTVAVWLNTGAGTEGRRNTVLDAGRNITYLQADVPDDDGNVHWRAGGPADVVTFTSTHAADWRDSWNHWAFVKDLQTRTMAIYWNAIKVAETSGAGGLLMDLGGADFDIGAVLAHKNDYIGKMDELKIYDYALSAAEIIGAATGTTQLQVPLRSPANIYQTDPQQVIDYKDFKLLVDQWLAEQLWP